MVQIIAGEKGRGKTPYLLEQANKAIQSAEGTIVFIDKNTKHMHDLDIKIRLINITQFPIESAEGFLGFIAGIISQDHDLEYVFLDSFLTIAKLEGQDIAHAIDVIDKLGTKYNVTFVLSISLAEKDLPDNAKDKVIVAL